MAVVFIFLQNNSYQLDIQFVAAVKSNISREKAVFRQNYFISKTITPEFHLHKK